MVATVSRNTSSVGALVAQHEIEAAGVGRQQRSKTRSHGHVEAAVLGVLLVARNRAHMVGDSVSATNADTAIVMVMVMANSRNRRPMMPPISSSGMNTATSETLIDMMVKPISPAPLRVASKRRHAGLDVAVDVLEHHDGVVDHEADRDGERHEREVVEAVVEHVHHRRRAQKRKRHGHARDDRGPGGAQEQEYHHAPPGRW